MKNLTFDKPPLHYVQIDRELCNGCVLCMQACPTKAIRVGADGKARIEGFCLDCGDCIRVCPRGAIRAETSGRDAIQMGRFNILPVSPALYAQFGLDVMPDDVLQALRKVFKYAFDQAYTQELFNVATSLYIQENRCREWKPWPLISPICPVVNGLIAFRFPNLLKHILPLVTPPEIVARESKRRLSAKYGCSPEDIKVFHLTPCAAKMICVREPMFLQSSLIDGALGFNEVFDVVKQNIQEVQGADEHIVLHYSSGGGIGWGMSGGESAGLDIDNYLAVSGIGEVVRYLEKIEMGLLSGVEYVEFRACPEGCIGGPLTVADKYQAKHTLQKLVRMFGVEKRVKISYARRLYEKGWFLNTREPVSYSLQTPRLSIPEAIERQGKVEEVLKLLPRKECGICGSPDCRTFAEDVVDGRASLYRCLIWERQRRERVDDLS